jgi:hypothetical protein
MTDETLLLRLRAETLRANLKRLKDHLAIPQRMADLDKLEERSEQVRKSINIAEKSMNAIRDKIDRGEEITWNEVMNQDAETPDTKTVGQTFEALRSKWDEARNQIYALRESIQDQRKKCFQLRATNPGKEIIDDLGKCTGPSIAELQRIQTLEPKANLAAEWTKYMGEVTKTDPIFTDYMEVLGAAALRDTGFDERISLFADELLRSTGGKLLALPMRRQAKIETVKKIIRVTFPDWTVWALPSSALEFWNVVGRSQVQSTLEANLRSLTQEERGLIRGEHDECMGDAYATYTMGPAYAYYAIGLILEPELQEHQCRVLGILAMLEQMDREESAVGTRYLDVRRQLITAWNAARMQFGQPPLNFDVEGSENGEASDPQTRGIRFLIRSLWRTLQSETTAKFSEEIWKETEPWVKLLLNDQASDIVVPNGAELRHLLNAAWLARVHRDRNLSSDLDAAVKKLQDKIEERRETRAAGKGR